ncbi:MAG TPA: zinc-binding dehydrogenase [Planctomycetaceae bacterium]|nr:zinc-binding dehydrogenase [Planctomycetaceae bacterium]
MFAAQITGPRRIELVQVPEPSLVTQPDGRPQIVFQPELTCLCGSDLPYFQRTEEQPNPQLGHSLHEMTGTVVATDGTRFKSGERVLCVPYNQSGFFERYVIHEDRAIALDPRVPEECALMAQPLGTAIFALKKLPTLMDQDVAVVGQGPMGQLMCGALRNLGAREIIAIDLLESRLANSPRMGATATICNAKEDPVAAVKRITGGRMADIVIEAVGHHDQALNLCIDLCQHGGRILFLGVPPEYVDRIRIRDLFFKNITLHTSVNPDFRRDFPLAMRWIGEGRIDVSKVITHRYPVSEIQTAFETFSDRKDGALKVLVEFPAYRQAADSPSVARHKS